ncbi:unnamed protein product, partial [Gongylonema pulchrum]|uniref:Ig-like domain-containing protein n=1 Tax=Gongylonema pulchrum TaxID=637853 RepID=A0A183EYD5_9BILA
TLPLPELRIEHHHSRYTCVAKNIIGESSNSIVLNVTYGAYIITGEQHQAVNPGETATFYCEAVVQSWQRGEYECVAVVEGFRPARLVNYLHIKGPPSVSLSEEIIAANGETLEIICEVCFFRLHLQFLIISVRDDFKSQNN